MKCDGSFVIVINLSISLLYSQAGGFFVLNSQRSKPRGVQKQIPNFHKLGILSLKFFYYIRCSLVREINSISY